MAGRSNIPTKLYDQVFKNLELCAKLAVSPTCRKLYAAKPANLSKKFGRGRYGSFEMCKLWEKDNFFHGLACPCCDAMHPLEYFDETNQESPPDCREFLMSTEHVSLHPNWRMNFLELKDIVKNLRDFYDIDASVKEDSTATTDYVSSRVTLDEVHEHRIRQMENAEEMILDGLKRTQSEEIAIKLQHHLGICYYRQRRFNRAEKCLQQTLCSEQNHLQDLDERALETMMYLGVVYLEQGRFDEAMQILPVVKEARSRLLGPQDKDTLQTIQMLAIAAGGFEPTLGKSHLWTLSTTHSFANLYRGFGDFEKAEQLYRKALRGYEQAMGLDHSTTLMVVHHLGTLKHAQKCYDAAETNLRRALVGRTLVHGATHTMTLESEQCLGMVYLEQDRLDLAETTLRQNLEYKLSVYSPTNSEILGTAIPLTKLCQRQGKFDDAKTMLMIAHEACSQEVSSLQDLELKRELAELLLVDHQNELAEALK
ncbi:hypothetical protein MMC18_006800 [Xylographa bjoerkii]|nr:hypothetical protein [Xylographa bjoerkii]